METKSIINPITGLIQYYITENLDYYLANPEGRSFILNNGIIAWDSKNTNYIDNIKYTKRTYPTYFNDTTHVIGVLHCTTGSVIESTIGTVPYELLYVEGVYYNTKEEWFAVLTPEEKYEVAWNL